MADSRSNSSDVASVAGRVRARADGRSPDQARALLAAIVDSSDDAIVSKSLDGTILSWNAAAERLFGYPALHAVGRHIALIIPPERLHEEDHILSRLRRGERIHHFETVRVTRDGRRLDVSLTISPIRDEAGRIIGASKIVRDITGQKRAEATVRASEQRLRQVMEALPAAVYTTDAHGRVTHFNSAAIDLSGRTPVPGLDQWCVSWRLYRADGTPLAHDQCPMAVALAENRPIRGAEILVERPDGSRAWATAYPTPLRDDAGNVTGGINMLIDITERKRAEEALIEQTRIAETLNRIGSALVAEFDVERIVQLVTDEATAVTTADYGAFFYNVVNDADESYTLFTLSGAPREAFAGFPMPRNTSLFGPTFRGEGVVRADDVTADPRFGQNPPYRGLPPGHLPVKSYLAVPVLSRTGEVLGGLFFAHEQAGVFTERHEQIVLGIAAQAAIAIDNAHLYARVQESDQRFRQLAQHATDVFWIFDLREIRMLYVSPAYEEIWGRSLESLYAEPRSFLDTVHPDDRARVLDSLERQQQGETTAEEYRVLHSDGTLRWVWDRGFPIRDEGGQVVRVAGITEDITERKVVEDRLRESEERYRRLTELLPVAVYACEAPSGKLTYYNEKAAELWGIAPPLKDPEHRFCGSLKLFLPGGRPLAHQDCPMAVAIAENRRFRNEEVLIERPDGTLITALVNIEPITDTTGRVTGAINVFLDVSALKNAERQLREADRRKDEFLATLSHELRNPLAPIRYALEMIDRAGDDAGMLQESREVLERQVDQMVRLIDDLLDVSRITHDKLTLRKVSIDLASVVQQAVEISRPLIDQAGHRLTVRLPGEPVPLHADTVRIVQVIGNLLSNAGKYTPSPGEIELVAERDGEHVLLSVRDNGQGIPPEQLDSIFEMFTQSESSLRDQGGLGIGLTLVKRLVEMHGGTVHAESGGPGTGSTFVVRLPVEERPTGRLVEKLAGGSADRPADAPVVPLAESGTSPAPTRRILVVDDNRDTADSLALLLSMAGHRTETAYDGESCLAVAEWFRPEVVLLDLGLPKLDGYEACRALRQQSGYTMTVAAVTGWGQAKDRERTRAAGFDQHLVKPVDLQAVEALLKSVAPLYER